MSSKKAMKLAQKQAFAKHRSNITNSKFGSKKINLIKKYKFYINKTKLIKALKYVLNNWFSYYLFLINYIQGY